MKVKTIKAVEAYRALKTMKVGGMSDDAMLAVWKNLKALRPVSEAYDKDIEDVRATLQDEEFEKMQQRVKEAQEVERKVKEEARELTEAEKQEIAEINAWFAVWNKKSEEYFKELAEKEVKVDVAEFEAEELLKAFKASDKTFEEVEKLAWLTK
jgi:SNF2 family DNA or RNA helicase